MHTINQEAGRSNEIGKTGAPDSPEDIGADFREEQQAAETHGGGGFVWAVRHRRRERLLVSSFPQHQQAKKELEVRWWCQSGRAGGQH
jgi:hypothetical protein